MRLNNPYFKGKVVTEGHDCACCQSELVREFRVSSHCQGTFSSPPRQQFPLQVHRKNLCFTSICKEEKENQTNSSQQSIRHEVMTGLSTDGCPLPQCRFAQCNLSAREHLPPDRELSVLSLHQSSYLHSHDTCQPNIFVI